MLEPTELVWWKKLNNLVLIRRLKKLLEALFKTIRLQGMQQGMLLQKGLLALLKKTFE